MDLPFIVGVIDLLSGRAVHARAGDRRTYQSVDAVHGDATALARFYSRDAGLEHVYVADLDAIGGRQWQGDRIRSIRQSVRELWLDAGIADAGDAARAREVGASRVVAGLETLASMDALRRMCADGSEDIVFSLDLREGRPVARSVSGTYTPEEIAKRAEAAGVQTMIVLDVARVGVGRGCDLVTIAAVRAAAPSVTLLAGGGVRDAEDLKRLADAGCDGALVATALLNGSLRLREFNGPTEVGPHD
jgi:phosphoribosylformimino-5-aminoimidazole carboxamide ribotide isomerase